MSLYDTIAAQLAGQPATNWAIEKPRRFAQVLATAASPRTATLTLNGMQFRRGDGLFVDQLFAVLLPTAAMTVQSLELTLNDNGGGLLMPLATPVLTTLGLSTSNVSLLFSPPGLITFEDILEWSETLGGNPANQPWQPQLIIAFSASTLAINFGARARAIHGLQEG